MRTHYLLTAALGLVLSACQYLPIPSTDSAEAIVEDAAIETVSQETDVPSYPGGLELVEEVSRSGDEIIIPYKKFRMPNGLTVILHEDNSDPLVHVDVTYHVGSGREDIGKSGFAHFFEHMMFQGSENVADEEHFKIISEAGGTLNGTTNTDRTNYFETAPANQLEKMLWLEADRMGFLLPAVTQKKFEVQRETVKNERGQRVDNAPYGLLSERVGEAMYPEGHPYSWSVIGYIEDLNRADLDDLKRFFLRWYGPNNAVLTIGGRLDEAQTLEWVAKYFGPIPEGPAVDDPVPAPVTLDADRYISMEDNVALPLLYMAWPTVYARHPDEAPLDVLNSILGQGRTSLMYKNLVRDGKAVQAQATHFCQELACQFALYALPNPPSGTTLTDIETTIRSSFEEFETRGVEPDDLERVKAGIISSMVFGLESVSGKGSQLAFYETFTGNPNYIQDDLARYEAVTSEEVIRVYETYIKNKPAVIMSIVPDGQPDAITAEDTWERYERSIPEDQGTDELALREPVDDFDRSIQPQASNVDLALELPQLYRADLANGIPVLGALNSETPTTALRIRIEAAQRNEPLDKLGLASLTAEMLGEATQNSTNEELSNRLAKLGSQINIEAGDEFTEITVRSLTDNLDATLDMVRERLFEPGFEQEDFDRLKGQRLQALELAKTQPAVTATGVFNQLLYGADNALAYPSDGQIGTVESITLDDVKAFYEANYSASVASVIAVSNLSEADMLPKLAMLSEWEAKPVEAATLNPFPELQGGSLYLIDKPDAAQSEIRIGKRALPYDATGEYYRAGIMNFILGGAFNSRINLNLREDKGYSYGAFSFFNGVKEYGFFRAQAGVRTDATADSIRQFAKEISAYQEDGITADELSFTRAARLQREARDYETPFQKLGFIENILSYDLPEDFIDEQKTILAGITAEELNALAAKHLNQDEMIAVVVGDKNAILPELETLGYEIIELDEEGKPVER